MDTKHETPSYPELTGTTKELQDAYSLYRRQCYADAVPLFRQSLATFEQTLGAEHPETLSIQNNLALTLVNLREIDEAKLLLRRCYEVSKRTLGPIDPRTKRFQCNLGNFLRLLGNSPEVDSVEGNALLMDYYGARPVSAQEVEAFLSRGRQEVAVAQIQ